MRAGLLGRVLGHSFSPQIHAMLADYSYDLFEVEPEALDDFLRNGPWDALNVTIPYKRDVIPYCAELSEAARQIGSVNTLVKRPDGTIFGHNTDADGFSAMLDRLGVDLRGRKALVLGSGGASLTARHVLKSRGAAEVIVISRSGPDNYENLERHADASVLVNTTPVGMYPNTNVAPLDIERLPKLEAVLDVIYNPARTRLIQDAMARGIPCMAGLVMLVEQARAASETFTGSKIPAEKSDEILALLRAQTQNIILIGMPGCGKTTVGEIIAARTGREFVDLDDVIEANIGMTIPEFFETHDEPAFRDEETRAIADTCKRSSLVVATGGGCITQPRNLNLLKQNGVVIFLERDLALLSKKGRPLSQRNSLEEMYKVRLPMYLAFADARVESTGIPEKTAEKMLEVYHEISRR